MPFRARVSRSSRHVAACFLGSCLLVPAAHATSDVLPNTVANRWVYAAMAETQAVGLFDSDSPVRFYKYSTERRPIIARELFEAYKNITTIVTELQAKIECLYSLANTLTEEELRREFLKMREEVDSHRRYASSIRGLIKLVDEFRPELSATRVDVVSMKQQLQDMVERENQFIE